MAFVPQKTNEDVHSEPAGILLLGALHPGVAAVFRVIRHAGASVTRRPGGRCTFIFSGYQSAEWIGWYSAKILANGWQPYDQPDPAAYMPFRYEALVRHEDPALGALLRQSRPDRVRQVMGQERAVLISGLESSLPNVLRNLLSQAGLPTDLMDGAVRFFSAPSSPSITQVA